MTAEEYFDKGYNCHNKGDYKEAIEYYNKTIELDPNYIEVYCNRGAAKCILKEYKAAIKDYNKAIELDSNYAIAYCNRGLCILIKPLNWILIALRHIIIVVALK